MDLSIAGGLLVKNGLLWLCILEGGCATSHLCLEAVPFCDIKVGSPKDPPAPLLLFTWAYCFCTLFEDMGGRQRRGVPFPPLLALFVSVPFLRF